MATHTHTLGRARMRQMINNLPSHCRRIASPRDLSFGVPGSVLVCVRSRSPYILTTLRCACTPPLEEGGGGGGAEATADARRDQDANRASTKQQCKCNSFPSERSVRGEGRRRRKLELAAMRPRLLRRRQRRRRHCHRHCHCRLAQGFVCEANEIVFVQNATAAPVPKARMTRWTRSRRFVWRWGEGARWKTCVRRAGQSEGKFKPKSKPCVSETVR